jgi:hypothetical protein
VTTLRANTLATGLSDHRFLVTDIGTGDTGEDAG